MNKKLLSTFIATIVLITSCSKEKIAEPDIKDKTLYPVTFNVSTFKSEIVPMANAAKKANKFAFQGNGLGGQDFQAAGTGDDWLGNKIQSIEYYVYNEFGTQVNHISQEHIEWFENADGNPDTRNNEKFGKIEDSLPSGKYKVVFTTDFSYFYGDSRSGFVRTDSDYDKFAKVIDVLVTDKALDQSIVLDRIVGKLEIKLLDEIPDNIVKITFSISDISVYHYLFGGLGGTTAQIEKTVQTTLPTSKDQLFLYFGYQGNNYASSGLAMVNIRAHGKEGNLVIDKIIKNVPVGINKTTILSGKLFEESGSSKGQGFSVSLQDKWLDSANISF